MRGREGGFRRTKEILGEEKIIGVDQTLGVTGGLHRAWSGEQLVLGGRGRRKLFEIDTVVLAIIVVPPLATTRCGKPFNKDNVVLSKQL